MTTYTKQFLSESVSGKGIHVITDTSPGTTIHTAIAGTTDIDELWLYGINQNSSSVALTLEYGGTGSADGITVTIPAKSGLQLIIPGLPVQDSLVIAGYATVASGIIIQGFCNRIVN